MTAGRLPCRLLVRCEMGRPRRPWERRLRPASPYVYPSWFLLIGSLLILIVLSSTLLARLSMSGAMVYLFLGVLVGPWGIGLIVPDPFEHTASLELLAEIAVLISLFTVGLRMGVPLRDRRWGLPMRLALVSMVISVGLIAALAVWGLGMSLGEGVLLGAILAPTDPFWPPAYRPKAAPSPRACASPYRARAA